MAASLVGRVLVRGPVRAETILFSWETFSALLFASAIIPRALDTPWPGLAFLASLLVSIALLRQALPQRTRYLLPLALVRVVAWPLSALALSDVDGPSIVATVAFGSMAGAMRRAVYRRELEALDPARDPHIAETLVKRLGESAMMAGIGGGHVLLLFSVAFLHAESRVLFQGWWQLVPTLGFVGTLAFTVVMRRRAAPVGAMLKKGPGASESELRDAIARARALPGLLSRINFAVWAACTMAGVFYFRPGPSAWAGTDAVVQLAYAALFSWGVAFIQRGWDQDTMRPVVRLLERWARAYAEARSAASTDTRSEPPSESRPGGRSEPPRARPTQRLRERMLRDFGGPLVFTAALSLLSVLGLYRTLGHEVTVREDLAAILAQVAAFAMLVIAVLFVVARVARDLSRPLTQVAQAAEIVASGSLETSVPRVRGPREVAGLASSVERMRETLATTIEALENERRTLEANVDRRTAQLRQALEELRDAQAALVQGERLASIGELVAGVAHEIHNPVNAIAGAVEPLQEVASDLRSMLVAYREIEASLPDAERARIAGLREKLDVDASLEDLVGIANLVKRATARTVRIVENLRNFSRTSSDPSPSDLRAGLDETLLLLGSRIGQARITVTKHYAEMPDVICRGEEIHQVFLNLIMNAIQAHELDARRDGAPGQLEIETRAENGSAIVSISDDGPGIPPEVAARMFDPFFTTKPRGQGTGLGLSISRDIVRKHGGTLTFEPRPSGGARFVLRIPLGGKEETLRDSFV